MDHAIEPNKICGMLKKEDAKIRFSKVSDQEGLKSVENLARMIWEEHYTPIIGSDQVEYMLQNFQSCSAMEQQIMEGMEYYLIELGDGPAGYLAFKINEEELFLSKIYVLEEKRGKGIGRKAMEFIENEARDQRRQFISLTVNKNNRASIRAYERMGFANIGAVETDIGSGFIMDDYVMRKVL